MKILSLELKNYKRFSLNNINHFKIDFKEVLQLILGTNGSGKAQPLTAKIKTPDGWTTMGDVKVNDDITTSDGSVCKVTHVHPRGLRDVYKVMFSDGRSTECCLDHLWNVYSTDDFVSSTLSTKEIIKNNKEYYIDLIDNVLIDDIELPLDSYLVGAYINNGMVFQDTPDLAVTDVYVIKKIGYLYSRINEYMLLNKSSKLLKCLGVQTDLSDRSIPDEYLNSSTKQRMNLLNGLMDVCGKPINDTAVGFTTTSSKLAEQVTYLVRSLGGMATLDINDLNYNVSIVFKDVYSIFSSPFKKTLYKNIIKNNDCKLKIISIMPIGIKEVKCITVNHPSQLYITDDFIVTHNSSLIKQLSPLPAEAKDFDKDGFKRIVVEHNNHTYTLLSDFSNGNKHTFIEDDIMLSDAGTITVQRDLVKEYFNLTPEIHNLITGKEVLDRMSSNKRKEWFLKICDTDYEFAISLYVKLATRLRDISGALKLGKKRLILENEKLIKDDEFKAYEKEISNYHQLLPLLLDMKKPIDKDIELLSIEQDNLNNVLFEKSNTLNKTLNLITDDFTIDDYNTQLKDIELIIYSNSIKINDYSQSHKKNLEKINILQKAEKKTTEDLSTEITAIGLKIRGIELPYGILDNSEYAKNALNSIRNDIIEYVSKLPINSDNKYNHEALNQNKDILNKLTITKENINLTINELNIKLTHMSNHKANPDLDCPKCHHKFSLGYNEKMYNDYIKAKDTHILKLNSLSKEISELEEYITVCNEYGINMRGINQSFKSTPILNIYWDDIRNKRYLYDSPNTVINNLNLYSVDIDNQISILKLKNISIEKSKLLMSLVEIGNNDLSALIQENERLDLSITDLTNNNISLTASKKTIDSKKQLLSISDKLYFEIKKIISNKKEISKQQLNTLEAIYINKSIEVVQTELGNKVSLLNQYKTQQSIADNINKQINEYIDTERVLKELVSIMSPTDGLIAEGLIGFINVVLDQMNDFIKKIWSYKLFILPCEFDDTSIDLNYKFPVIINNDENIINDVSEGSTGMLDIINLAFRIVAMKYLKIGSFPLFLDEWGSGFDTVHRQQAVNIIKTLCDQQMFDQVFIISHYSDSYNTLTNSEVCVLDDSNIELPKSLHKHNQHVTFN